MRRYATPATVTLAVLVVVTIVLAVLTVQKQSTPPPSSTLPVAAPQQAPPSVAFIGDGYTSGSPAGGQGPANYTALLANQDGWRVTNASAYGSGYVAGATLDAQVAGIVSAAPQLVVVSGGRADDQLDPDAVRDAAGRLYQDIRTRLPRARIVVIGPLWIGGDPPRRMRDVRDVIRDAATAAQLPFVDPLSDNWFGDAARDATTPTGDLTDAGHRLLAALVDDAVRRSGVTPRQTAPR